MSDRRCTATSFAALSLTCLSALACNKRPSDLRLASAETMIDAFYSFDRTRLDTLLRSAGQSRAELTDYQAWAMGGNYSVHERHPCLIEPAGTALCAVTVKDDIVRSLELKEWVTDTFRLMFAGDTITKVTTSSNDPQVVRDAFTWVRANRPALYDSTGPCASAGPNKDRAVCAREVMRGFRDFHAQAGR